MSTRIVVISGFNAYRLSDKKTPEKRIGLYHKKSPEILIAVMCNFSIELSQKLLIKNPLN